MINDYSLRWTQSQIKKQQQQQQKETFTVIS